MMYCDDVVKRWWCMWWWCIVMMLLNYDDVVWWWSWCVVAFVVVGVAFVVSSTYAYEAMAWKYGTTMAWKYGTTMALIGTTMRGNIAWHVQLWHMMRCNGTTCILHIWVSDDALLSRVVVSLGRCRCIVFVSWCEIMLVTCNWCYMKHDVDVILWFKLLDSFLWIMCLLLLNVNLTPSVWMLPLRG